MDVRLVIPAIGLILALAQPAAAAPGDMTIGEFLDKAAALRSRGMLAALTSDYRVLKHEGAAALRGYNARLTAERAEGRPSSCPPGRVRVDSDVVLNHLQTYPSAERDRIDLHRAVADYYRRTWPCRSPTFARLPR